MGRNCLADLGIEDLFSDHSGLVTYIAETERHLSDPDIFVLASEMCDTNYFNYKNSIGSNGSGAGLTYKNAYYSTLGECAERYSLSVICPEKLLFGNYYSLKAQHKISNPALWKMFHESQLNKIPFDEFTDKSNIAWVYASDLLQNEEVLIPACAVYLPYFPHFSKENEKIVFPAVSTGAACSVSFTDAILKGIYELIERDAFIICWRNQLNIPEIIIDENSTIYSTYLKKFKRDHLEFKLYYTKLDMKVHSVFGLLYADDNQTNRKLVYCGGACHHSPEVAVIKTLLELVQGLKWGEYCKSEKFTPNPDFSNVTSFKDRMLLYITGNYNEAFSFLKGDRKIELSKIKRYEFTSDKEYLIDILYFLKENNFEVYAIDVAPVDIEQCNLKVVKVLIPNFETMEGNYNWQFLGKTRYLEIPKKFGIYWN